MPVLKCSNGKYRIGEGACIYDTKEKADEVWRAILASGAYQADSNKISFDFDDTLDTDRGQELAKKFIAEGKDVYIITRRQKTADKAVIEMADKLGIKRSNIYFTNGSYKWETVKRLDIGTHYDNNQDEIDLINEKTECKGVKF
jgi:hypothetical protein